MILGVGTDLVDVERARRSLERWGARWARRIFTDSEMEYCEASRDPAPRYAARFAAKEAAFKALPVQPETLQFTHVEVLGGGGKPAIRPLGSVKEALAPLEPVKILVSLTHEKTLAAAIVIIEKE